MVYVDTSALVPIFIREPWSDAVIGWLESSAERLEAFAGRHCTVAIPRRDENRRAANLARHDRHKLSAGDALHPAIAQALRVQSLPCLDEAMSESARVLGIRLESV